MLLVLLNPSKKVVEDYTLSLVESPMRGPIEASLLFGEDAVVAPIIDDQGGFLDYTSIETLPPQEHPHSATFILDNIEY
jgi:hypothetical protein